MYWAPPAGGLVGGEAEAEIDVARGDGAEHGRAVGAGGAEHDGAERAVHVVVGGGALQGVGATRPALPQSLSTLRVKRSLA